MFVVGALDDLRDVSPPAKVAGQVFSASLLAMYGVTMFHVQVPFNLFGTDVWVPGADYAPLITVLWVVLMANAINLIDGLDGLAAGIVAIGGTALFLFADRLFNNGFLEGSNIGPLVCVDRGGRVPRVPAVELQPGAHHHGRRRRALPRLVARGADDHRAAGAPTCSSRATRTSSSRPS